MPRKMSQDEFIERASKKYPNLDFSDVKYINNSTKVHVICEKHGDMYINPNQLLQTESIFLCKKCSIENGLTHYIRYSSTEEFLKRFQELYPNQYDYFDFSKTIYNGIRNNIIITCPVHGDIITTPFAMLMSKKHGGCDGKMCKLCNQQEILSKNFNVLKYTINSKYPDIEIKTENIVYSGNKSISQITIDLFCKKHKKDITLKYNTLKQYVNTNHSICRDCEGISKSRNYSTKEFIELLKDLYPDKKYDYSETTYINWLTKVKIICPEHGTFYRLPQRLEEGRGCPYCKESLLEREMRLFLNQNEVNFIYQYRNKSILGLKSLDFFLPDFNVAIECQGRQHLKEKSKFNSDCLSISEIYNKDYEKYQLCLKSGIKIYYYTNVIPQKEYFEKLWYNKHELLEAIKNGN